ncbi:hypothetical protein RYX36_014066 [Vicia faba]
MSCERKCQGRQKIEMKKMSNESNLQVTFSRRRSGLFKKASELCTLCDAQIALVVFSPSEKVFSFGHPNIDTVIDRYLYRVPPQNNEIMEFIEARRKANVCEINTYLTQINNTLISDDQLSNYKRKCQGRQKIEMKKMSNESNLQVTFSRRGSGLFKKVSELCTLCDAQIAFVVFSPSKKVFSFGHPNIDTIIYRYLYRFPPQNNDIMEFIEAHRKASMCEINTQLTQINNTLDIEKKLGDELSHLHKEFEAQFWWTSSIDKMNWAQLEMLKKVLGELRNLIAQHAINLVIQDTHTQTLPFCVDSVSPSNIPFQH